MASGRVGGTKSKVSGQIGDEIYQIVRNDDGTYSQVVMAKGVKTVTTITERGRAQQMCTAMIESLMAELKAIGSISFQSGANKSKSLNAFSSFNLRRVADDCKANWYEGNKFYYPECGTKPNPGGLYLISSGTLRRDIYGKLINHWDDRRLTPPFTPYDYTFIGFRIDIPSSCQTIYDLMRHYGWTRRDSFHFVFYHYRERRVEKPDGDWDVIVERESHDYVSVQLAANISDNAPLTQEVIESFFGITSSYGHYFLYDDVERAVWIGYNDSDEAIEEHVYDRIFFYGGFSISYASGKKQVSSHTMVDFQGMGEVYLYERTPANVFGGWMGQPRVKPWPSPFIQQNQ